MGTLNNSITLIKVGTLIDGTGSEPLKNIAIEIDGRFIKKIFSINDEKLDINEKNIIDLSDYTVLPGIVDAHMHFFGVPSNSLDSLMTEPEAYRSLRAASEAKLMLESGITSARCLGSSVSPALKRAIDQGVVAGPRLVVSGQFVCSSNGTWDHLKLPIEKMRDSGMIADGAIELRQKVRERLRQGANVIKVGLSIGAVGDIYHAWGDDPHNAVPSYTLEEIQALTDEAHKNRIKVSAHCIGDEAVRNAVLGGVDVIEHGYPMTGETRKMVVDRNLLITSTASQLFFHNAAAEEFHYSEGEKILFKKHEDSMREYFQKGLEAGIRYCLGTDLIGPPTHPQHLAAKEFEIAVNWGMTPMQAIVAGTKTSAEALGMEDLIGTIENGKFADLIAIKSDPLKNIKELQDVKFVMKDGEIVRNSIGEK